METISTPSCRQELCQAKPVGWERVRSVLSAAWNAVSVHPAMDRASMEPRPGERRLLVGGKVVVVRTR